MKIIDLRILSTGLLFIISFVFGIWLSNTEKPLNVVLFSIHKISAILSIILVVISIYNLQKSFQPGNYEISAIIITGIFILVMLLSGILLSFGKPVNNALLTIHKVTSIVTMISIAITIYLLINIK